MQEKEGGPSRCLSSRTNDQHLSLSLFLPSILWPTSFLSLSSKCLRVHFFFFAHVLWLVGSQLPDQRANLSLQQWEHEVLRKVPQTAFPYRQAWRSKKSHAFRDKGKFWLVKSLVGGGATGQVGPGDQSGDFSHACWLGVPGIRNVTGGFLGGSDSKVSAMRETWVRSLGQEDPLEKEMATHSSILPWEISWTEEPGGLQSMELQRIGHYWMTNTGPGC